MESHPSTTQPEPTIPRPSFHQSKPIFSPLNILLLVFLCVEIIGGVVGSTNILRLLLFMSLALLPTFIFALLILKSFPDPAVPNQFLFSQFLISATILHYLSYFAKYIFLIIFILPFLFKEIVWRALSDIGQAILDIEGDPNQLEEITELVKTKLELIVKNIPILDIAIFGVIVGYFLIWSEECGKWLVSRRYRSVDFEAAISGAPRISARGILSSACMSALGYATVANLSFMKEIGLRPSEGWLDTPGLVFLALFNGVLMYLSYTGAQLYVAVTAAQDHLFHDGGGVLMPLLRVCFLNAFYNPMVFSSLMDDSNLSQTGKLVLRFALMRFIVFFSHLVIKKSRALLEKEQKGRNER